VTVAAGLRAGVSGRCRCPMEEVDDEEEDEDPAEEAPRGCPEEPLLLLTTGGLTGADPMIGPGLE